MALESVGGPMEEQENPLERDHSLSVVLPGGVVKTTTVHGSKPVMDLLVTLCATYHLNPSDHTVEVLSPNRNNIAFKPNCPIGLLEAERILLKPKGVEEKTRRPYMPEATVRLLINYKKSHKAVVRVNPRVPLAQLMPAICEKCEFEVETTVLLRDAHSEAPLDLTITLNDYGLREVYAKDTAVVPPTQAGLSSSTPTPQEEDTKPSEKEKKQKDKRPKEKTQKENKGFFSLFKRSKKKLETDVSVSAPASPTLNNPRAFDGGSTAAWSYGTMPADVTTKKRRAPPPPSVGVSQSVPDNLSTRHLTSPDGHMKSAPSRVSSMESSLKRTKRKAPPPPPPPACANAHLESPQDSEVTGSLNSLYTLKELRENDELGSPLPSPSPPPSSSSSSSSSFPLHLASARPQAAHVANPYQSPLLNGGKDPPSPSVAVARIMNHALASGVQLKSFKTSSAFPRMHNGSSVSPGQKPWPNRDPERVPSFKLNPTPIRDPALKTGMTTFTVVPCGASRRRLTSFEVELTTEVPDRAAREGDRHTSTIATDEARDHQTESPGPLHGVEVKRPVSESDPPSEVLLTPSSTPPCPSPEAQLTLPPPEMGQTSPSPQPDHTSLSPEPQPDHTSLSPEPQPDHTSLSPEPQPDHTSLSPEPQPDHTSLSPEPLPEHTPQPPKVQPEHTSQPPEVQLEHTSPLSEVQPDLTSRSSEVQPEHTSPPLDLAHTPPPPKASTEEELEERAEVTDNQEAASASPEYNTEEPEVPPSPPDDSDKPPAVGDLSTAEGEGPHPRPDVESPKTEPAQQEVDLEGEEDHGFPPPPPPMFYHGEAGEEVDNQVSPPPTHPPSVTARPTEDCCGDHLTHLTSPKPYRPPSGSAPLTRVGTVPSRFAQAVAQAVRRSQFPGRGRSANRDSASPSSPSSQPSTVPEWLPRQPVKGSSCLG